MAILVRWKGGFLKIPPIAAQLLHHFNPSEQNTPALLHHVTLIDKLPPLLQQNGRVFGRTLNPGRFKSDLENQNRKTRSFVKRKILLVRESDSAGRETLTKYAKRRQLW